MRTFFRRTALLLLPVLVQALVLPKELLHSDSFTATSGFDFDSPSYGGPSTFFEYDIDENIIKFTIPCPDCSDEEKELLKREIISVKPTLQTTQQCTSTDPIGLEIDGEQISSTGESRLALQSHIGPFNVIEHSKHHIFNRTRWINHCGCTKEHPDQEDCTGNHQSSFSFEVLGLPSGQIPGFTVSYKQHGKPELLRFSTFPDIGIADSWRFGQSAHYQSPLLRLQKAMIPTSTAISSSSSFSPSSTFSASLPSYTYFEKTLPIVVEVLSPNPPSPTISSIPSQILDSNIPTGSEPVGDQHSELCRLPSVLAAVSHGIEAVAMKAKSSVQTILGKIENVSPTTEKLIQSSIESIALSVSNVQAVSYKLAFVSHDELDDAVVAHNDDTSPIELASEEEYLYIEIPNTPRFYNNPTTIKAFQVTSLVFIVVALSGSLFALTRRNPRLRAKWAAILEENRNQRLYRHAARKRRFQNFFSRFKSGCSDTENKLSSSPFTNTDALNWEEWEKRINLGSSNHNQLTDDDAISRDLLAFRKAHQFVDGIISAEEGRPSSSRHGYGGHTRRHRAWSFGSEKTAPPAYESESEDLVLDADGPRFVVLKRGMPKMDISPDSSVVSTSPRDSCADSDSEYDEKF